jgi:hypothetical protein
MTCLPALKRILATEEGKEKKKGKGKSPKISMLHFGLSMID